MFVEWLSIPDSVEELEELSTDIVEGELLDDAQQKLYWSEGDIKLVRDGVTRSTLKIDKVYKGASRPGDLVTLMEPYFIEVSQNEEEPNRSDYTIVSLSNYDVSEPGRRYLFFLHHNPENEEFGDCYSPVHLERGRYPVLHKGDKSLYDMTNKELNLGNKSAVDYKVLYAKVARKYMWKE